MSAVRRSLYGSLRAAVDLYSKTRSVQSYASRISTSSKTRKAWWTLSSVDKQNYKTLPLSSVVGIQQFQADYSRKYSTRSLNTRRSVTMLLNFRCDRLHFGSSTVFLNRAYSSHAGDKQDGHWNATADTSSNNSDDTVGRDWVETLNHARQTAADAAASVRNKAKELSDEIGPYMQQLYDSHPYVENVILPVGGTLSATVAAWFIMPRILRKVHKYSVQSPLASLSLSSNKEPVSYEKSLWSALEDPARYLITFMAFSQL